MYFSSTYLVHFKYLRPNLIIIIIFSLFSFLWYQKKGWIVVLMSFFSFSFFSQLFSVGSVWVALAVIASIYQQFLFFGVQSLFTKLCTTEIMNAIRW